ncbi:MAG: GNAT family N-acetyltransferase [Candidatus Eremiobacteraeota bacterium]|nr:GNAT family N-acetyltransferase [Candidatus Eremiobacteraeota bacterium]
MANVEIHRADPDDFDDLLPLFRAYRLFYERAAEPAAEHRFLSERLANADSTIFIARDGTSAVGFVQLFTTFSSVYLGPVLLLEDLFVHPDARGRGTASALLGRSRGHAAQLRAVGMFLETAHTNRAAQRVYERAGWQLECAFRKYNCPLTGVSVP